MPGEIHDPRPASASTPRRYRNFDLRFHGYDATAGAFKVHVEGMAPGGSMRPDDAPTLRYNPLDFWDDAAEGIGGLLGTLAHGRRDLTRDELGRLGMRLADMALPEGLVRDIFNRSLAALKPGEGLRLRLRLDPAPLAQLPWEYMALPRVYSERPEAEDFLALRQEISIVRADTIGRALRALPRRPVARVAGVLSSPQGQPSLQVSKDKDAIDRVVADLNQASAAPMIEVSWAGEPATRAALQALLQPGADLFHFAGHGAFSATGKGQILLEKESYAADFYDGEQLAQLMHDAGVRLAVLGACDTGRRGSQNVWSGVATALTSKAIPAVIANQFRIADASAALLAAALYPLVLGGYTVDEALYQARRAIYQANKLEHKDWGVPVLYLHDEEGVLFPLPDPAAPGTHAADGLVRVVMEAQRVAGELIGARIKNMEGGAVDVRMKAGEVEKGGRVTGVEIDSLSL